MDKILIVDDDDDLRRIVRDVLQDEGFSVTEAEDGVAAIREFGRQIPDVVLLDLNMPRMNGIETIRELKKIDSTVPVIIVTAYGDVPTAVEALKSGAYDFTLKPPEFERLITTIKKGVERRKLAIEMMQLDHQLESSLEDKLGRSESIKKAIRQIRQIAMTDISLIIEGETGTGKSVVAGLLHNMSKRAERPFIHVDIGLIPEQLIESELFGYKKGAFTGADKDRTGYFENANGGTIFLDELENMSANAQMKMLSVIERKVVYPLGSAKPLGIDVRVISATNADIRAHVSNRQFREDLFYRLGEFIITLPPLRERPEDIPFFAGKFLFESCAELNKQINGITPDALDVLVRHTWPGNLRELKNVVRRAVLLSGGDTIRRDDIDIAPGGHKAGPSVLPAMGKLRDVLKSAEQRAIADALRFTGFNKSRTAELLDTSYTNLLAKIKEYGIMVPEKND
ncbi:MAG: sigma-54-dependent transcriptional regulator [Thermodesulfovibrionales bacterium]